jgi:hypothetical protein
MASRIQNFLQENRAVAHQIERVHQENPYLQERAALERRRRSNLALEATNAARSVKQARREQLQRFGEACEASINEDRETEALSPAETVSSEVEADRFLMAEERSERLRQRDAALEGTTFRTPVLIFPTSRTPVIYGHALLHRQSSRYQIGSRRLPPEGFLGLLGFRQQENHSQRAEHLRAKSLGKR